MVSRNVSLPGTPQARTIGAFIAIFSLGMALLILFALPGSGYMAGIQLMIVGLAFIGGIITLVVGQIRSWRRKG